MDFQDMRIFGRVAALQNLSAVGTELGLTPGTISKRIQALEDELKVRLFDRTTRSIRITDEGRTFLDYAERILSEVEQARAAVSDVVGRPKGRITVSAPASLGRRYIAPAVCAFMRDYPEVDIQIDLADHIVNLHEGGYDLAIRTGSLSDSTLIAKRLAPDRQVIVASPAYLERAARLETPKDLQRHNCMVLGETWQWSFSRDGEVVSIRVSGRLKSNSGEMLRHAAADGQGLIRTSQLRVAEELSQGALVQVLDGYEVASNSAIWAVYPSAKHVLPKLRVFIDFLSDWFRKAQLALESESVTSIGVAAVAKKRAARG